MRRSSPQPSFVLLLALAAGCGDDMSPERLRPNQPPETALTVGPPDSTDATHYRVHLQWSGTDPDGAVARFDLIVADHPPIQSHMTGDPGDADPTRVMVEVPAVDDPRWAGTTAFDSVLVTLADTLRRDPRPGPGEDPDAVRGTPYERWHTVFVRAVDDRGLPDPTPDYRSFNSHNIAPIVHLEAPVVAGERFFGPTSITFRWNGEDPVDETTAIAPVASRFVLIDTKIDFSHLPNLYANFPESLYALPERHRFSTWQPWDPLDASSRRAFVSGLAWAGQSPGFGFYIFAVQAMDEAGAITPVFDWSTPGKNNVALVQVNRGIGPLLIVHEPTLGMAIFEVSSQPVRLEVAGVPPLRFRWSGDASRYGGTIAAYRYGWDLRDPNNDDEWQQDWSPTAREAPALSFPPGSTHRFHLQVRDDGGFVASAVYELVIHAVTRTRHLLWVDDTDFHTDAVSEATEDARWLAVLGEIAAANGFGFDPVLDVYDVRANREQSPPIQKILDYESLVWSVRGGRTGSSGLRRAAQFFDPSQQRNHNTTKSYSVLLSYLTSGGKLWINGFRPAKQLWPDERERGRDRDAVNVTNWDDPIDDPIEPNPQVDSVGVNSLLYRMGIEVFDVGSGIDSQRLAGQHFCLGLRSGDLPGTPALQVSEAWPQGGTEGRTNIGIYNMPNALAAQAPPLVPQPGISATLYTYVSGVAADPSGGVDYPMTADGQPVFVLAKESPGDLHWSRAFCGFEPYLLTLESHRLLVEHILVQQFQLGAVSAARTGPGF